MNSNHTIKHITLYVYEKYESIFLISAAITFIVYEEKRNYNTHFLAARRAMARKTTEEMWKQKHE